MYSNSNGTTGIGLVHCAIHFVWMHSAWMPTKC